MSVLDVTAPGELDGAARSVAKVVPLWAQLRLADRARYLRRAGQALIDEFDDLLSVMAVELRRPRAEIATLELLPALDALEWIAEQGPRVLDSRRIDVPRMRLGRSRARVTLEPLGVVGVISSRDTPWALPLAQVAAALMGGNGVVFKPSAAAATAGERLGGLFVRAGLPEGLLRVLHGGHDTAAALVDSTAAKLFASGSREAMDALVRRAAEHDKPLVTAAHGHDAMLVLEDANLDRAIAGALWGAYAAAGQAPGSVGRALVVRELAEQFADGVKRGARALRVGDPLSHATQIGPLASPERLDEVRAVVEVALDAGATLRCGGPLRPPDADGPFYAPAVVTGVEPDMRIWRERVDGPVLAVLPVESAAEAVAIVNDGHPTLGASIWTQDRYRAARLARELRVGASWGNEHLVVPLAASAPWGDPGRGGHGRALGEAGLRGCVQGKVIGWREPALRARWRLPYHPQLVAASRALAQLRSVRDADRERALRHGMLALARVALGRRRKG